ncbi:putative TIM-barrel fold metal-dependent hydrolase [Rhizobium azooxidifex]|uniref:Putative TIM-barrel fold metal-dependent hydrolase n=1 Tax=Mycoplana azooxidifex TaxID=1636188 RepID=A0A7W6D7R7_9HYPH|nr:amidohydrolase family protein [Mycoplana azooxidifex]MBB3977617.1 putative TIM-barrel fold metal-dependent hydrolase [Mycoplana azooxidifex]
MRPHVIDIHPHIISTDTARYPRAPLGGHQSDWSAQRPVSWERLLADMAEAGVDKAAIVQASTCYGHDNGYVIDAVAARPDKFTAVGSVDILADDAVQKIDAWMAKGLTGLRLFTTGSTMPGQATWFTDPKTYPAWAHAEQIGVPVCMQMTQDGIDDLQAIIKRFPKIRIVLDHLARPDLSGGKVFPNTARLFELAENPNIYFKLTVRALEALEKANAAASDFFPLLVSRVGASQIAWGSNHPASPGGLKSLFDRARAALSDVSSEDQAWIFGGTAQRIYPALADVSRAEARHG